MQAASGTDLYCHVYLETQFVALRYLEVQTMGMSCYRKYAIKKIHQVAGEKIGKLQNHKQG